VPSAKRNQPPARQAVKSVDKPALPKLLATFLSLYLDDPRDLELKQRHRSFRHGSAAITSLPEHREKSLKCFLSEDHRSAML